MKNQLILENEEVDLYLGMKDSFDTQLKLSVENKLAIEKEDRTPTKIIINFISWWFGLIFGIFAGFIYTVIKNGGF